ncbi:MAG: nuclease, partial [Humibacillus sp.]|nr:nuclease [Humibacillus sp.]
MSAGVLNERRAELVASGTSHLSPELRRLVDAEVVGGNLNFDALDDDADDAVKSVLGSWGDREVERRVRACADRLDADAAVKRARAAESERRVGLRPVPDTMA